MHDKGGFFMSEEIVFKSAADLWRGINIGEITSVQTVSKVLKQINLYNKSINAIVTLDESGALNKAAEADEANGTINLPPLQGIPITIKDIFKTAGMRSTASHPAFKDYIPDEDATVVRRLKEAGAIVLGKTNMPEMAMDCQTVSPLFGRTNNPWNLDFTPGGSCGGGAAAVASGMSFLDIGNDLLGSLRIPAHFCGIYSFTSTEKFVPSTGLLTEKTASEALNRMMRTGILARSVEDCKTALKIISGPDNEECDVLSVNNIIHPTKPVGKLRVLWTTNSGGLAVSKDTREIMKNITEKLASLGHKVDALQSERFDFKAAREVFLQLFYSVISIIMPAPALFLMKIFGKGTYLNTNLKKYFEAEQNRIALINSLDSLFYEYDVLLCPVTATPAFPHMKPDRYMGMQPIYKKGVDVDGKMINYSEANMGFTVPFSVTGNPVVVFPAGLSQDGLPIGIQAVGRRYYDLNLLDMAAVLSEVAGPIRHPCMDKYK